ERDGRAFLLIDTAGLRRRARVEDAVERVSIAKTLQAIDEAHVVILVLDAHDTVAEQDASVLGLALERGRALVIAVNKWDGILAEQRAEVQRQLALKLDFAPFAPLPFISARHRRCSAGPAPRPIPPPGRAARGGSRGAPPGRGGARAAGVPDAAGRRARVPKPPTRSWGPRERSAR